MSKTLFVIEAVAPHASLARAVDFLTAIRKVCDDHKCADIFVTQSGPFPDHFVRGYSNATSNSGPLSADGYSNGSGSGRGGVERTRSEAGERAAADFADEAASEAGAGTGGEAAEPKRGRGRPPGSGKAASGSASGERSKRPEGTGNAPEGNQRNVTKRTDKGTEQGSGEGEGRARSPRADRGNQRSDPDTARVDEAAQDFAATEDDWNDAAPAINHAEEGEDWWAKTPDTDVNGEDRPIAYWPDHLTPEDIGEGTLAELLAAHFNATGGKDRGLTFAVMEAATGERAIKNVHPDDYDNLARHLLKDAARYKHGVKKAK